MALLVWTTLRNQSRFLHLPMNVAMLSSHGLKTVFLTHLEEHPEVEVGYGVTLRHVFTIKIEILTCLQMGGLWIMWVSNASKIVTLQTAYPVLITPEILSVSFHLHTSVVAPS